MNARIKKVDRGYQKLLGSLADLKKGPGVSVGIHAKEGAVAHKSPPKEEHPRELTVVDVAAIQEFGLGVPERSWLRDWFEEASEENRETLRRLALLVLKGQKTAEQALELAGLKFVGDMQKRISQGIPPPNAPSTIAAKGSSTPLIDSGQMRQSLSHLVRMKS